MTPNQNHAEQGLHHLRLAVMDVLAGGQCLGPSEIRRRSGIDEGLGHGARWGQFMTALLDHMEEAGPRGTVCATGQSPLRLALHKLWYPNRSLKPAPYLVPICS